MRWGQLEEAKKRIQELVSAVALKSRVAAIPPKKDGGPAILLAQVWTESRHQQQNLTELLASLRLKSWSKKKITAKTTKDRFLWKTTVKVEYVPKKGKPLAVRLAESGRPGQEEDPSYPT